MCLTAATSRRFINAVLASSLRGGSKWLDEFPEESGDLDAH